MECFEPGSFALYSTPSRTNYQDIFQAFWTSCIFNSDDLIGSAFISSSHSSNMWNSYIHHVIFSGYITNPFSGQLPVGYTGILEVKVRIDSNSYGFGAGFLFWCQQTELNVFDDQMIDASKDKRIVKLFTRGSHHCNLSVIYIAQNLFHRGKGSRSISLNSHYLVLFKNPVSFLNCISCIFSRDDLLRIYYTSSFRS